MAVDYVSIMGEALLNKISISTNCLQSIGIGSRANA